MSVTLWTILVMFTYIFKMDFIKEVQYIILKENKNEKTSHIWQHESYDSKERNQINASI